VYFTDQVYNINKLIKGTSYWLHLNNLLIIIFAIH